MSTPQNIDDLHHDDIVEEDNPLPRWWVYLFIGTVIFAVIYIWFFHFGPGQSQEEKLDSGMKKIAQMQKSSMPSPTETGTQSFEILPEVVTHGKVIFDAKCAACHGPQGQGTIGPNLVDAYWISGDGSGPRIYDVIHDGVPEKGMMAWKDSLSKSDLHALTVYVLSLKGSNPANPKAQEGTLIE